MGMERIKIDKMSLAELRLLKKEINEKIYKIKQKTARSVDLIFRLTMPDAGSHDGKWSGTDENYTIKRKVSRKTADELLKKKSFSYKFGGGWRAAIEVSLAKSKGEVSNKFSGYGWMIDSIIMNGCIKSQ